MARTMTLSLFHCNILKIHMYVCMKDEVSYHGYIETTIEIFYEACFLFSLLQLFSVAW